VLKKLTIVLIVVSVLFFIDQYIKMIFVNGFEFSGECISLVLVYNKGVAFSMFSSLAEYLKYIQLSILFAILLYLLSNPNIFGSYYIAISLIFSGGLSNIYDRFIHEGVVDYVYWHCGFDFAVFNLADVLIDIAIVLIVVQHWINNKQKAT